MFAPLSSLLLRFVSIFDFNRYFLNKDVRRNIVICIYDLSFLCNKSFMEQNIGLYMYVFIFFTTNRCLCINDQYVKIASNIRACLLINHIIRPSFMVLRVGDGGEMNSTFVCCITKMYL
jgi:hypothetical protein